MPATKTPYRLPEELMSAQSATGHQACPFLLENMAVCGPDAGGGPDYGMVPERGTGTRRGWRCIPARLSVREINQVQPSHPTQRGHSLVVGC